MIVYLLAALTAFASFVNEVNLSQSLSGALGGTILRYHTSFGLFTCFLGLGAWAFDSLGLRLSTRKILLLSQVGLIVAGGLGPLWIRYFNPLMHAPGWEWPLTALCYFPLVLTAFISGLELPAWFRLSRRGDDLRILAWDYFGMFVASVCYPLVLLYQYGVFGSAALAVSLNCFVLIILLFQ